MAVGEEVVCFRVGLESVSHSSLDDLAQGAEQSYRAVSRWLVVVRLAWLLQDYCVSRLPLSRIAARGEAGVGQDCQARGKRFSAILEELRSDTVSPRGFPYL